MAKNKKIYILLGISILGILAILSISVPQVIRADPLMNTLAEATGALPCQWQTPQSIDASFFKGYKDTSSTFLKFSKGYSRLGRCSDGIVAALVLTYDNEKEAEDAIHVLSRDIPSSARTFHVKGNGELYTQRTIWKVKGPEGTMLYVALWREGSVVKSITVETSPETSESIPLEMMRRVFEVWR